jgi:molecular chaperone Hsp31 and glyoxalase 3
MGCCSSKRNAEGNYDPSPFTILIATSSKTKYTKQDFGTKYAGTKPILVVATDEGLMTMANGKVFSTGNHPVEMFVPMLHFRDAGFSFDFATASGKPVVLERWAYPSNDENVKALHEQVREMMEKPKKLEDIPNLDNYSALFVPGGHGCMINLPTNVALGKLLNIAHGRALPTVTLCHGPSVFLATCLEGTGQTECAYTGYKTMCFTDKTDAFTPKVGYLPGHMPWKVQEAIEAKGLEVVNKSETGAVSTDRELITGDSPDAANKLGIVAAPLLVKFAVENGL